MNSLFYLSSVLYLLSSFVFLIFIANKSKTAEKCGNILLFSAFGFQTAFIIARYFMVGATPVASVFESLNFFGWSIALIYIVINSKYHVPIIGGFSAPLISIFMIFASFSSKEIKVFPPVFETILFPLHISFAFLGDGFFALAFLVSIMYLIQESSIKKKKMGKITDRLPSLDVLDEIAYKSLTYGFPLLTLGIITGAIWAEIAWGTYWTWDPKETWSLITWFIYAALLHARYSSGFRGRKAAILSIAGFLCVIFTFLGVNFLMKGQHKLL